MTSSKIRVGLVLSHSLSYCREILRGIRTFALERPEWLLTPIFPDRRAVQLATSLKCNGRKATWMLETSDVIRPFLTQQLLACLT